MIPYFEIYIPGKAVPQRAGKVVRRGKFFGIADHKDVVDYKNYLKTYIGMHRPERLTDKPVRLELDFYFMKPKSWAKKKSHYDTKPDWDNLSKLVGDCLQDLVYTNDSRVVEATIKKHLADSPGVKIVVYEME